MTSRRRRQRSPEDEFAQPLNVQTLSAAIAEVRNDLRNDINDIRDGLRNDIRDDLRNDMRDAVNDAIRQQLGVSNVGYEPPIIECEISVTEETPTQRDAIDHRNNKSSHSTRSVAKETPQPLANNENEPIFSSLIRGAKLERFIGSESKVDAKTWIQIFEHLAHDLNDKQRIVTLVGYLTNDSLVWFSDEIANKPYDWDEVRNRFLARYGTATVPPIIAAEQRRMTYNESVRTYAQEKMRLLRMYLNDSQIESALYALTSGTLPAYRTTLMAMKPKTFDDWLHIALSLENSQQEVRNRARTTTQTVNVANNPTNTRTSRRRDESPPPPGPCQICQQRGVEAFHWHSKCPNRSQRYANNAITVEDNANEDSQQSRIESSNIAGDMPSLFIPFDAIIGEHKIKAFLDTGSTLNIISAEGAKRLNLWPDIRAAINVAHVGGSVKSVGCVDTDVTIGRITKPLKIHVMDRFAHDLLIGQTDAGLFFATCDFSTNSLTQRVDGREEVVNCIAAVPLKEPVCFFPLRQLDSEESDTHISDEWERTMDMAYGKAFCAHTDDKTAKNRDIAAEGSTTPERRADKSRSQGKRLKKRKKRSYKTKPSISLVRDASNTSQTSSKAKTNTNIRQDVLFLFAVIIGLLLSTTIGYAVGCHSLHTRLIVDDTRWTSELVSQSDNEVNYTLPPISVSFNWFVDFVSNLDASYASNANIALYVDGFDRKSITFDDSVLNTNKLRSNDNSNTFAAIAPSGGCFCYERVLDFTHAIAAQHSLPHLEARSHHAIVFVRGIADSNRWLAFAGHPPPDGFGTIPLHIERGFNTVGLD